MFGFLFFEFGSIAFWLLLVLTCIGVAIFSETSLLQPTIMVFLAFLAFSVFGNIDVFGWVGHHPVQALLIIPAYFVAGVFWSLMKWYFYVNAQRRKVDRAILKHTKEMEKKEQQSPDYYHVDSLNYLLVLEGAFNGCNPLSVSKHKTRILSWMIYWPMSFVWTMINDPVRRAFSAIFDNISGTFQKMANKAYTGIPQSDN